MLNIWKNVDTKCSFEFKTSSYVICYQLINPEISSLSLDTRPLTDFTQTLDKPLTIRGNLIWQFIGALQVEAWKQEDKENE